MLHIADYAASPLSSVTAENVLRGRKGDVKLGREKEKGVGNLPVLLSSTSMWAGLCLDRGVLLQSLHRCSGGKGKEGDVMHFPNGFLTNGRQHVKPLGCGA